MRSQSIWIDNAWTSKNLLNAKETMSVWKNREMTGSIREGVTYVSQTGIIAGQTTSSRKLFSSSCSSDLFSSATFRAGGVESTLMFLV